MKYFSFVLQILHCSENISFCQSGYCYVANELLYSMRKEEEIVECYWNFIILNSYLSHFKKILMHLWQSETLSILREKKILDCISHQSRVDFITLSSSILEEICVFTFNKFQWDCQAVFHGENKLNFKNENLYTRKEYRSFFRNIFIFLVYQ